MARRARSRVQEDVRTYGAADRRFPGLDEIVAQVEDQYGSRLMRAPGQADPGLTYLPTGIAMLDYALLGGLPEGRVCTVFGWESSGKTTLAIKIAASSILKHPNKATVFVDAEGTFDSQWAQGQGLDPDSVYLVSPESGEQAVNIIDAVLKEPETGCVIVDSLPALVPQAMIDAAAEDAVVARRAQLIGRLCSIINSSYNTMRPQGHKCTVVFVNQWRYKIGPAFGDPRILPGGQQPKYLAQTMIEVKSKPKVGKDSRGLDVTLHTDHTFVLKKHKGASLHTGEYCMIQDPLNPLGLGAIDQGQSVATLGKSLGFIAREGNRWQVGGYEGEWRVKEDLWADVQQGGDLYLHIMRTATAMARRERGLLDIPPDRYLFGFVPREEAA